MCLAIPSRIIEIKDNMGTIDVDGVRRKASLLLLEDAGIGDYVIVHAGFAIQKLSVSEAEIWIVNLLRDSKVEAKVDSKLGKIFIV